MVAIRGRTFKKPWQRSCLSSKLKSSSAPIGREDSWCFHAVGSSNAPLLGSTAAEGLQRIGRTSIATRWRSCGLPQSASCSENFVIPPDVFGQTLSVTPAAAVRWLRDIYGNSIAVLTFEEASQRLCVASEVDVELYDDNPIECLDRTNRPPIPVSVSAGRAGGADGVPPSQLSVRWLAAAELAA